MTKTTIANSLVALVLMGCAKSNAVEAPAAWEFSVDGSVADAAAQDGTVYVGASDGNFYSLDAQTGHVNWRKALGLSVYSRPAVQGDLLFVAGSQGEPFKPDTLGPGQIVAMDRTDADVLWQFEMHGSFQPQVSPHGDRVVGRVAARVYCLDAQSGEVRWEYKHRTGPVMGIAQDDSRVVVQGADGRLYALNATDGGELWAASARDRVYFRPVIVDGRVITGNLAGELIAFDAESGEEAWTVKTGGGLEGRCVVIGDALVFTNRNAEVYAVDAKTGAERWSVSYEIAGKNSSQFAGIDADNGRVGFSALEKGVYVLDAESGVEIKHIPSNDAMSFVTLSGDIVIVSPLREGPLRAVSLTP